MVSFTRLLPAVLVPAFALTLGATPGGGTEIELDEAEVFIEFNSTDGDFGIQFFWDGEPWDRMKVEGPDGRRVLKVRTSRSVADQGLTEGFFESAEPDRFELTMEQFLGRFPEGEYEFEGKTLEGDEIEGETEFTHTLPAPPANLSPAEGDEIDPSLPLVASFDAVTTDFFGAPLAPELYKLVVETENGILKVLSVTIDGDEANPSITIPPEFIKPDTEYKLEVIVQEESGNRTISETAFCTGS